MVKAIVVAFMMISASYSAQAHPQFDGIWVTDSGVEIQIVQIGDELFGYSTSDRIEVFHATVIDPHSDVVGTTIRPFRIIGYVWGSLEGEESIDDQCFSWDSAWLSGNWTVTKDGLIEGTIQPLEIKWQELTQRCNIHSFVPRKESVFRRTIATTSSCIPSGQYDAWVKQLRPYIQNYYDRQYFDNREPSPLTTDIDQNMLTRRFSAWVWDHKYYKPESLQIYPIGAPQFPVNWPEVRSFDLNHAEWAISQAFIGPLFAEPDEGEIEQQLWYRNRCGARIKKDSEKQPTIESNRCSKGWEWKRYEPCQFDFAEDRGCTDLGEDEIGNEIIAEIPTLGVGLVWNVGKRSFTWVARRFIGSRLTANAGESLLELEARRLMDDLVRIANCERGSITVIPEPPILDLVDDLPRQIYRRDINIGPAYRTIEEAAEAARYVENGVTKNGHYLEVVVSDKDGSELGRWFEASRRGVGRAEVGEQLGHTEQLALLRVRLREGIHIEMRGFHHPCRYQQGCFNTLEEVAEDTGVTFLYRRYNTAETGREMIETMYHIDADDGARIISEATD